MRITDVRTVIVNAEMRNWVFVRVETDQPGLYGWGEATLEWKTHGVAGCVEDFKPLLIGEDPTRIEHIYQKLDVTNRVEAVTEGIRQGIIDL